MAMLYTLDVEDRPGTLGFVAGAFHEAGINIDAFMAGPGGLRIIANDVERTQACMRGSGISFRSEEVIEIELQNEPGALATVAKALGDGGVNIHISFGAAKGQEGGSIFIGVDDVDKAWSALEGLD